VIFPAFMNPEAQRLKTEPVFDEYLLSTLSRPIYKVMGGFTTGSSQLLHNPRSKQLAR
jgi:hypothetical protein